MLSLSKNGEGFFNGLLFYRRWLGRLPWNARRRCDEASEWNSRTGPSSGAERASARFGRGRD